MPAIGRSRRLAPEVPIPHVEASSFTPGSFGSEAPDAGSFRDRDKGVRMKISEILSRKGSQVVSVSPDSSVTTAIRLLVNHGIGSVVVKQDTEVVGILTERDILRLVDRDDGALTSATVATAMTRDLIVALPSDDVGYVMEVLTKNRIRHLPVMEGGEIRGIISIGDVVNALRREVETENRYLRDYVQGMVS